ncbi:MAG: tetratricopeptide repeat protein [Acidobacteria bacterium]|jgi:tetratricopeptide (TPR) repeat protein|nr:tetratricopeptide repeat protein [Acidobacteriota bacterium]
MRATGAKSVLRRVVVVLSVLAGALSTAPAAAAEKQLSSREFHEAIAHCRRGDEALSRGDLSRASEQFEKALAIVPEFPEAYTGLGHIALVRRDYAAALGSYTRARDAYERIGQQLYEHRLQQKGRAGLEVQSRRDDIMNLTKILQGGSALESRIREIEREISYFDRMDSPGEDRRATTPANLYFFRGNALFHLDRLDEAVADWEEASRRAPEFGPVYNNLALAYWKLGQRDKAQAALARAEQLGVTVHPDFKQQVVEPES